MGVRGRNVTQLLRHALWYVPVGIAVSDLVASVIRIDGESMQPTLNPSSSTRCDWVIVEKCSMKLFHHYGRGDVVVLWAPDNPNQQIVKRIIALEGDVIMDPDAQSVVKIPLGRCWIEGDNALKSGDSRTSFGPVHLGLLEGRVTHVVWPPWRAGRVAPHVPSNRVIEVDVAAA